MHLQGGLDHRVSGAIITASECCALLAAFVIALSMLGVNVSALLLPAGVALALAAKDLSHNFLAGAHARRFLESLGSRVLKQPYYPIQHGFQKHDSAHHESSHAREG